LFRPSKHAGSMPPLPPRCRIGSAKSPSANGSK
jgi:hypothetical protein